MREEVKLALWPPKNQAVVPRRTAALPDIGPGIWASIEIGERKRSRLEVAKELKESGSILPCSMVLAVENTIGIYEVQFTRRTSHVCAQVSAGGL